jgi:GNAT superfamily N-acetyltransferase
MTHRIRSLEPRDHDALVQIYRQAVLTSTAAFYSVAQQSAWASQCDGIRATLEQGRGLVSCTSEGQVVAFCLRDPSDRIALLYSDPRGQRRGHGRAVLAGCSTEAAAEGETMLRTEASLISRPLFESLGWRVSWREELLIAGVHFQRFRMHRQLRQ